MGCRARAAAAALQAYGPVSTPAMWCAPVTPARRPTIRAGSVPRRRTARLETAKRRRSARGAIPCGGSAVRTAVGASGCAAGVAGPYVRPGRPSQSLPPAVIAMREPRREPAPVTMMGAAGLRGPIGALARPRRRVGRLKPTRRFVRVASATKDLKRGCAAATPRTASGATGGPGRLVRPTRSAARVAPIPSRGAADHVAEVNRALEPAQRTPVGGLRGALGVPAAQGVSAHLVKPARAAVTHVPNRCARRGVSGAPVSCESVRSVFGKRERIGVAAALRAGSSAFAS